MPKPLIDFSALSIDERLRLIDEVWASVVRDDPTLARLPSEEWFEIERRAIDHEHHPETAVPWEEVKAGLLRSIGRTE
jgi:putative addiction module component (TIGR02574 family)